MVSYWIKIAGSSAHYSHCFWWAGGGYLGTWHLIITLSIMFHFVFSSWKKLRWLINRPVDALKVLRYWHCSVSHSWAHDNKIGVIPICNTEGWIGNNDTMGFCTVFPLECEGWNEGFDFECFDVLRSLAYILWCSHWKWKNGIIYIYIYYIYKYILYILSYTLFQLPPP